MNKVFVKKDDLKLVNGGYLVIGSDETPVFHDEFVSLQKRAEFIVEFANEARNYDFKGKQADSLTELKEKITNKLNSSKAITYLEIGDAPKMPTKDKLAKEAMEFIEFDKKKSASEKVNKFLQDFNLIKEFEDFGLYFEKSQIVKLNKIYTIDEIVKAVESTIELL